MTEAVASTPSTEPDFLAAEDCGGVRAASAVV